MNPSDAGCIKQILNGETSAFSVLVNRYKNQSYGLALKVVKNEEDAEEVVQDALMKAYKALRKFRQDAQFSTWLYRIVYNTALTKAGKRRIQKVPVEDYQEELEFDGKDAVNTLVNEDRKHYLHEAILTLNEEDRTIVHLYYKEEKDAKEIAEIMNMSHVNIRVRLSRIRKKLYDILRLKLKEEHLL